MWIFNRLINKYFITVVFLLSILCHGSLKAQFYSTGTDPASAKWEQINTDNFQIIFQHDFTLQAKYIASSLEYYYNKVGNTLAHKPKKFSVIVHNQTMYSNGYVAWAPKRMELFTTPPQDFYSHSWIEHLVIHELRHVVQIDKLNQGISRVLSIVFGQQAIGLVAGQLPMWYFEGDAVSTETAFTKFGRGRAPYFYRGIKTLTLSGKEMYSFDKMLFGSYRDYVPNHYELGYQLTAFARYNYGPDIWNKVENYVAKNSYTLLPTNLAFYRALKKYTGLSQKELFNETVVFLDSLWTFEETQRQIIEPNYIQNYAIDDYENYLHPICIDSQRILALKKGLSHIPQFVLVNQESERVLFEPGQLISNDFSYAENILVWAEYKPDIRWENREFTSLKLFNINTGVDFTLVKKSRYFSPDISKTAEKIVVVEVNEENKASLIILGAYKGEIIKEIDAPSGNFIQRPKWSDNEKYIYIIELTGRGKQVSRYSLAENSWELVFKDTNNDIQRILPANGKVYFHSTKNGTDNIYVYDEINKETYQISASRFGTSEFDLCENGSDLIINDYTSQGFRLAKIPIERAMWKKSDDISYRYKLADELVSQETVEKEEITIKEYESKPYRKALNLFNFHSWVPAFIDYDNLDVNSIFTDPSQAYNNIYPGVMLLSQNKLSTVESIVSYGYKNEKHYVSSSLIFKGQYPVVELGANYGNDQFVIAPGNASWRPEINPGYSYEIDVYVPFKFSSGNFIRGFQPLISLEYFDNFYYNNANNTYTKGLEYLQSELLLYSYKIKSERDIIPSLGAILDLNLYNTPFEKELFGYLYNVNGIFYLPGGKNKGIKINLGYQFQKPKLYLLTGTFRFPRGIKNRRSEKLVKLYGDYMFPIAYPDWNLGSVLYLKRIRGDIFADYAFNTYRTVNAERTEFIWPRENIFSFGLELTTDYHLLRTMFPLNSGIRIGYSPTESKMIFEMIFGIDLYNF